MESICAPMDSSVSEEYDVTIGLGKEASMLFQAGKFVECLKVLNQLLQKREDDPKICHNMLVAETYKDGCSDPKRLVEALENVKRKSEELARASGEHLDVSILNGTRPAVDTNGDNHQFCSSTVAYNERFDPSVTIYNIAVVWFHLLEYTKSFSYLDALYQNIVPIDEGTAVRICFLLLDVSLLSRHASRSADVISYMEKAFYVNPSSSQLDNGTPAHLQLSLSSKLTSNPTSTIVNPDLSLSDSVNSENSLTRTLSEEALEHELSSLDINCEQNNLKRPTFASSEDISDNQSEDSLSSTNLKHKLHLYKVRFFLLTQNLKSAKREVKMAMNTAHGKDYQTALYLKSQLEFTRGNHTKAMKLLIAAGNDPEKEASTMYYNNFGCIYYHLGEYHTSGVFFAKALKFLSQVLQNKHSKQPTILPDKKPLLITYNIGLHSLACGRPSHAVRFFQKASRIFHDRPLMWIRIAECCIMALEKGLGIKSISSASDESKIKVSVIGKGKWRYLAAGYEDSTNRHPTDLSATLARNCLNKALRLLDSSLELKHSLSSSESTNQKYITNGSGQINSNGELKELKRGNNPSLKNSIPDYDYFCKKENHMLMQATLADLAYVELVLENPLKALSTAKSLLELPDCSKMYVFLGTIYAAESLCLLNRPNEASEYLMRYLSGDTIKLPYGLEDCKKWTVVENKESDGVFTNIFSSPEVARGVLYANYAANSALLGDLNRSAQFATMALSELPNDSRALMTAIYVDLKRGKTQEAIAKLKERKSVRFVHESVSMNG